MGGIRVTEPVKEIVIRMNVAQVPLEDIITYTGISKRTVQRIIEYHRKYGTVAAVPSGLVGRPPMLNEEDKAFLYSAIQRAPDRYLDELVDALEQFQGVKVTEATLSRNLASMNITMKQITKAAIEQSEESRAQFKYRMGLLYTPEQLVFVDESAVDRRSTFRNKAWSLRGQRVRKLCFFVRGKRYSVLPALSIDGVIWLKIVEGSFDSITFAEFIDGLLENMNPYPGKNSVVVMDNCRIHQSELIREMVEARGMRLEYLPAYSPDYNPIELLFSSLKFTMRRKNVLVRNTMLKKDDFDVYRALHELIWEVLAEHAEAWYRKCGYF